MIEKISLMSSLNISVYKVKSLVKFLNFCRYKYLILYTDNFLKRKA